MIDLPYEGATPEQLENPYVHELLAIHNMFRSELANILGYTEALLDRRQPSTEAETATHIKALVSAGIQYTRMLHMHHHIETASIFPMLRAQGLETAVVDRLNAEHDEIAVLIDNFTAAVAQLSSIDPQRIDSDLRRLSVMLQEHLAYEETRVCPLLARI